MTWFVVLSIAVGTFLIRSSLLAVTNRQLPPPLAARLTLVAPAALGALTVSAISHDLDIAVIVACAVGCVLVHRTGNVNHALIVGFPTLWLVSAIGG